MIIIRDLFFQITLPKTSEFAIYTNDYYIDEQGNVLDTHAYGDVYEYGDLIIQTVSAKYIIRKVYSAYDYAARIMEYIKNHAEDSVIYIYMNDLNEYWDQHHEGKLEIE